MLIRFQPKNRLKVFAIKIFSQFWAKMSKPQKKIVTGKIVDFEIFVLKYVTKHSESVPTKKIDQKLLILPLFHHFGQKMSKFQKNIVTAKKFRFRDLRFEMRFKAF